MVSLPINNVDAALVGRIGGNCNSAPSIGKMAIFYFIDRISAWIGFHPS
jgi:hypothetical protein